MEDGRNDPALREEHHVLLSGWDIPRAFHRRCSRSRFLECLQIAAENHTVSIRSCRLGEKSCCLALTVPRGGITPFLHDLAVAWRERRPRASQRQGRSDPLRFRATRVGAT